MQSPIQKQEVVSSSSTSSQRIAIIPMTPKTAAKMPYAVLVLPRAVFDDVATELAGLLTGVDMLERVALAEMLMLVREDLEEEIDVMPNNSEVLVDAKVRKLWARLFAVRSLFGHRGAIQSVSPVVNSALYEAR